MTHRELVDALQRVRVPDAAVFVRLFVCFDLGMQSAPTGIVPAKKKQEEEDEIKATSTSAKASYCCPDVFLKIDPVLPWMK